MHIRNWLALGLGLTIAQAWSLVQAADAPPALSMALSLEQARVQRVKAKTLKHEADALYEKEKVACQSKLMTISCQNSARERHIVAVRGAETMGREARTAEREIRQQEVAAKEAKRAAEAPANEVKQRADVERYREKEAQRAVEREKNLAEQATKLESRRSKASTEKAAREKKMEERRVEDAKRAEKAPENARKAAERKAQHAERMKKIDERVRKNAERRQRREADDAAKQSAPPAQPAGAPTK
jgi:hypothetical protein